MIYHDGSPISLGDIVRIPIPGGTAKALRDAGHEVIEAATGQAAIDAYVSERPDAVLMDITMPEMDGLEALDQIRTLDPSAKVAMLSAVGQKSVVLDAVRRGARELSLIHI